MAAVHNFSLDQGSDKVVYFVLRDKSGPIDLSGYSAACRCAGTHSARRLLIR